MEGQMAWTIARRLSALSSSATDQASNIAKELASQGVDVISLCDGEPKFDTPENIKEAAWKSLQEGKTKYGPTGGIPELRELIRNKMAQENHIETTVENVIVTPGAKFPVFLTFLTVLDEGDRVVLLDPSWVSYAEALKIAGAEAIHVPLDEKNHFQPDLEQVKSGLSEERVKLIVVNSPCNPTGAVFDQSTLFAITKFARENNVLVLSDEIYEHQIYEGEHYSPGSEFDNVITINGFSKPYAMTGWRIGYVTGPEGIIEAMLKIYSHSATCVAEFIQAGAVEALKSEESRRARDKMAQEYRERRDVMMSRLEASEFFDCVLPNATIYSFPSYRLEISSIDFSNMLLKEAHVATVPGIAFGKCGEGHVRMEYTPTKERILEAFERIDDFLRKAA
jgi:aspartate aminotransferase